MSVSPLRPRRAFTLIELLVVMVIIGLLVGLLIPGVQKAREAARRASCQNNLKQINLAVANFEAAHRFYPPSWKTVAVVPGDDDIEGWSVFGLLLPYLEQNTLYQNLNFDISYELASDVVTADGTTTKISALRVPTYLCPSERRDEVRFEDGVPSHYPINYAVNLGIWLVWNPATKQGGLGAFYPESKLASANFKDGHSYTLGLAEVKGWNPYFRNAGLTTGLNLWTNLTDVVAPTTICDLGGSAATRQFKDSSGHTEWVDGRAHQIGFTTLFRPNAKVLCNQGGSSGAAQWYDVDWTNWQEGKGMAAATPNLVPTYAAVTARSYHGDGVNAAMMDGSVRFFADDINLGVWRAFSTRDGGDIIPSEYQGQ